MVGLFRTRPVLRQYCADRVLTRICRRDCLHIDVWLIQDAADVVYFVVETRIGGFDLVKRSVVRVDADGATVPMGAGQVPGGVERRLNGQWALDNPRVLAAYQRVILPMVNTPLESFKSRSIKLHCVVVDAALADPTAGLVNYYGLTGRGRWMLKDSELPATLTAPEAAPVVELVELVELGKLGKPSRRPRMAKGERSRLRTLDKLLGLT